MFIGGVPAYSREEWIERTRQAAYRDLSNGVLSPEYVLELLLKDLQAHPDTRQHPAFWHAYKLKQIGKLKSTRSVQVFIERFVK